MNLHGIVSGAIGVVNPFVPVTIRLSTGSVTGPSGKREPSYATPGSVIGSIAGTVFSVEGIISGAVQVGQVLSGANVLPGTTVVADNTGEGSDGVYAVSPAQTAASGIIDLSFGALGQVQPLSTGDVRRLEGLNIQGVSKKIYMSGVLDGLVRAQGKGGDLLVIESGPHAGTYLVTAILEQFPDWVCAGLTLQNE